MKLEKNKATAEPWAWKETIRGYGELETLRVSLPQPMGW